MKIELTRGERFKDARLEHNQHRKQTMDDVQKATGVSKGLLSQIENDTAGAIGSDKVAALARQYGVTADYLLGLSDNPTTDENLKTAIKVTGLSQRAIEGLQEMDSFTASVRRHIEEAEGKELDEPDCFDMLDQMLAKKQGYDFFQQLASVQHFVSLASMEIRSSSEMELGERHELLSDAALAIKRELYWLTEAARALAQEVCGADSVLEELEDEMVAGIISYNDLQEGGSLNGEHS